MIDLRNRYHVALDGLGYVLSGSPESPAYSVLQAAMYTNRLAQGDRTYDDFSKWWYWSQSDWSAGMKDEVSWSDDGKYFYSSNIDTWSEPGSFRLATAQTYDAALNENIICGGCLELGGVFYKFIGTEDGSDSRPNLYLSAQGVGQSWVEQIGTSIDTNQNLISQVSSRASRVWLSTVGTGTTCVVMSLSGGVFTDHSGDIYTDCSLSVQPASSRCHLAIGGTLYVFVDNYSNSQYALVKASTVAPASGDWSKVFEALNTKGLPFACCEFAGDIYYLVYFTNSIELRKFDLSSSVDSSVYTFRSTAATGYGVGDKLMRVLGGKLIVTVPADEVWSYDGSAIARIFKRSTYKRVDIGADASVLLTQGCVAHDEKLWWGNLMYDGSAFFYTFRGHDDVPANFVYPMFVDNDGRMWMSELSNIKSIYYTSTLSTSTYKPTYGKNYIVFNQFDKVAGIEKVLFSVTVLFKKLVSGQKIYFDYAVGELNSSTTWTALGTASNAEDGGSVMEKTFYFAANTTCKRIWYRFTMESDGANSPSVYDVVTAYLPVPILDRQWNLSLDCGDKIRLLGGQLENLSGRQLKGNLELAWVRRQIIDFQDIDYADTTVSIVGGITKTDAVITVADASLFPEAGRLRIENEVIYYTGKTQTTFTGCLRGQKGTAPATHADGVAVHNGYKVIIQNYKASVPILNREKQLEYTVSLNLREVI